MCKYKIFSKNNKQSNNKKLKYFVSKVFQYIILKQTNHKTITRFKQWETVHHHLIKRLQFANKN